MSDIREGYYRLQIEKFKTRMENIRSIIKVYNDIIGANPTLASYFEKYMSVYSEISKFQDIIIKSQEDIDYYVRLITEFENALKAGYQIIYLINPHIKNILQYKKLADIFQIPE